MLPVAPVQAIAESHLDDAPRDDRDATERRDPRDPRDPAAALIAVLEGRACISVGLALIAAAVIVPLATPYAVLLSTIGVIPLILASQHGIMRSVVVTALFPVLLVSGALDRRQSLDVDFYPPPATAGDAPYAFIVRTDALRLVVGDVGDVVHGTLRSVGLSRELGDVRLAWAPDGASVALFARPHGTLPGEDAALGPHETLVWRYDVARR